MHKKIISGCVYAFNELTNTPLKCDVCVLVENDGTLLWHENLFLCDIAKLRPLSTVQNYASDLLSFTKMAKLHGGWSSINQRLLTGYLHGELFQSRQLAKSSMKRHIETLKLFYGWLTAKGYLPAPPRFEWGYKNLYTATLPDTSSFLPSQHSFHSLYMSESDFDLLLSGVRSKNSFIEKRNEIVLRLGYECGTRAHEVLFLESEEVRKSINDSKEYNNGLWATTRIPIIGKGSKLRDLYIPPDLCETIMHYLVRFRSKLKVSKGALICTDEGTPFNDKKFASNVFSAAYKRASIFRAHRQGYHRLRKCFGTNLVDDCYKHGRDPWVEVPRRLGHQTIEITKKYIQFEALLHKRSALLTSLNMAEDKYKAINSGIKKGVFK